LLKTLKSKAVCLLLINALSALESVNFQLEDHYMWKGKAT